MFRCNLKPISLSHRPLISLFHTSYPPSHVSRGPYLLSFPSYDTSSSSSSFSSSLSAPFSSLSYKIISSFKDTLSHQSTFYSSNFCVPQSFSSSFSTSTPKSSIPIQKKTTNPNPSLSPSTPPPPPLPPSSPLPSSSSSNFPTYLTLLALFFLLYSIRSSRSQSSFHSFQSAIPSLTEDQISDLTLRLRVTSTDCAELYEIIMKKYPNGLCPLEDFLKIVENFISETVMIRRKNEWEERKNTREKYIELTREKVKDMIVEQIAIQHNQNNNKNHENPLSVTPLYSSPTLSSIVSTIDVYFPGYDEENPIERERPINTVPPSPTDAPSKIAKHFDFQYWELLPHYRHLTHLGLSRGGNVKFYDVRDLMMGMSTFIYEGKELDLDVECQRVMEKYLAAQKEIIRKIQFKFNDNYNLNNNDTDILSPLPSPPVWSNTYPRTPNLSLWIRRYLPKKKLEFAYRLIVNENESGNSSLSYKETVKLMRKLVEFSHFDSESLVMQKGFHPWKQTWGAVLPTTLTKKIYEISHSIRGDYEGENTLGLATSSCDIYTSLPYPSHVNVHPALSSLLSHDEEIRREGERIVPFPSSTPLTPTQFSSLSPSILPSSDHPHASFQLLHPHHIDVNEMRDMENAEELERLRTRYFELDHMMEPEVNKYLKERNSDAVPSITFDDLCVSMDYLSSQRDVCRLWYNSLRDEEGMKLGIIKAWKTKNRKRLERLAKSDWKGRDEEIDFILA